MIPLFAFAFAFPFPFIYHCSIFCVVALLWRFLKLEKFEQSQLAHPRRIQHGWNACWELVCIDADGAAVAYTSLE